MPHDNASQSNGEVFSGIFVYLEAATGGVL